MSVQRRTCRKCGRNRAERFYVSARGHVCSTCRKRRVQHGSREQRLLETHYLTLEEYELLLAHQDGKCYICEGERPYNLDVDHDHLVERQLIDQGLRPAAAHRMSIRGLLCKQCNRRLLPSAKDNVATLKRAIRYLEVWPADEVLRTLQP